MVMGRWGKSDKSLRVSRGKAEKARAGTTETSSDGLSFSAEPKKPLLSNVPLFGRENGWPVTQRLPQRLSPQPLLPEECCEKFQIRLDPARCLFCYARLRSVHGTGLPASRWGREIEGEPRWRIQPEYYCPQLYIKLFLQLYFQFMLLHNFSYTNSQINMHT